MNVGLWAIVLIWVESLVFVFWPFWLVPLLMLLRSKQIKNKVYYYIASTLICSAIYLLNDMLLMGIVIEYVYGENWHYLDLEDFDTVLNFSFVLSLVLSLLSIYFLSKLKLFKISRAS